MMSVLNSLCNYYDVSWSRYMAMLRKGSKSK